MPLSRDKEKRGRQIGFLKGNEKRDKKLTGLQLEDPRKIKIKLSRTINSSDKTLISEGEVVLNNFELVEPPTNFTIQKHFESQPLFVQEGLARTFGRDKTITNELIQKRLNSRRGEWVFALPLMYENEGGKKITEDPFKFIDLAYRDRIKITTVDPKKLIKFADKNEREERAISQTRQHIKDGRPIPTPRVILNKENKVQEIVGMGNIKGAIIEKIDKIPVYVVTTKPIETMSRLDRMKLDTVDFKKV